MLTYRLVHSTEYSFGSPVGGFELVARLRPVDSGRQQCRFFQLLTRPPLDHQEHSVDDFGNHVTVLQVHGELQRLLVSALSTVTVKVNADRGDADLSGGRDPRFLAATDLVAVDDGITTFARQVAGGQKNAVDAAAALGRYLHTHFRFAPDATDTRTTARVVLNRREGVCQDFAHLAVAALRAIGIPARYVSGYLHTAAFRKERHRIAADVSHAWFEAYDGDSGWFGFDPANGIPVDVHHIVVARGRDYNDISPLVGTFEGDAPHTLKVSVDVQQI